MGSRARNKTSLQQEKASATEPHLQGQKRRARKLHKARIKIEQGKHREKSKKIN